MEHETKPAEDTAAFGDLTYFAKTREIRCAGKTVPLTMTELALLRYMLEQSDRAIPREELLDEVWGITADIETRVTDETVRRIRKKLTAAGSRVSVTVVWGYGYKLEEKA